MTFCIWFYSLSLFLQLIHDIKGVNSSFLFFLHFYPFLLLAILKYFPQML